MDFCQISAVSAILFFFIFVLFPLLMRCKSSENANIHKIQTVRSTVSDIVQCAIDERIKLCNVKWHQQRSHVAQGGKEQEDKFEWERKWKIKWQKLWQSLSILVFHSFILIRQKRDERKRVTNISNVNEWKLQLGIQFSIWHTRMGKSRNWISA